MERTFQYLCLPHQSGLCKTCTLPWFVDYPYTRTATMPLNNISRCFAVWGCSHKILNHLPFVWRITLTLSNVGRETRSLNLTLACWRIVVKVWFTGTNAILLNVFVRYVASCSKASLPNRIVHGVCCIFLLWLKMAQRILKKTLSSILFLETLRAAFIYVSKF